VSLLLVALSGTLLVVYEICAEWMQRHTTSHLE